MLLLVMLIASSWLRIYHVATEIKGCDGSLLLVSGAQDSSTRWHVQMTALLH